MKITLHSIQDLHDLMALFAPVSGARAGDFVVTHAPDAETIRSLLQSDGPRLSDGYTGDGAAAESIGEAQMRAAAELAFATSDTSDPVAPDPELGTQVDSRGIPWSALVHSSSKALNKSDGTWRAARGVDKDLLAQVEAELLAQIGAGPEPAAEPAPVVTETHALPSAEAPVDATVPGLAYLAERAAQAAGDAPDGVIAVLDAGKRFIEAHGVATFNAVKGAVVGDTPTQKLQPAERRLLCAALSLYDPAQP